MGSQYLLTNNDSFETITVKFDVSCKTWSDQNPTESTENQSEPTRN